MLTKLWNVRTRLIDALTATAETVEAINAHVRQQLALDAPKHVEPLPDEPITNGRRLKAKGEKYSPTTRGWRVIGASPDDEPGPGGRRLPDGPAGPLPLPLRQVGVHLVHVVHTVHAPS